MIGRCFTLFMLPTLYTFIASHRQKHAARSKEQQAEIEAMKSMKRSVTKSFNT